MKDRVRIKVLSLYLFPSQIDFDQWLVSGLEAELAVKDSNYRIVRRRVAWLLGQWSGVKLSPALRPKLYQVRRAMWEENLIIIHGDVTLLRPSSLSLSHTYLPIFPFFGIPPQEAAVHAV